MMKVIIDKKEYEGTTVEIINVHNTNFTYIFKDKSKEIDVPENIEIELDSCGSVEFLKLRFNKCKQVLFKHPRNDFYEVGERTAWEKVDCVLIPCKREDLKTGDIAYSYPYNEPNFKTLELYYVILNEEDCAIIAGRGGISIENDCAGNWWKVVRKEMK